MTGVAIIGLHRGGTSAVAGILHGLGAYMGSHLLPPSKHNPKGYYEDERIVRIHTEFIGGEWVTPDVLYNRATYRDFQEYKKLIAEFKEHDLWAIKDPRLCHCLPLLHNYVPDIKVILVFRDPWYAASSLVKRNEMSFSGALSVSLDCLEGMIGNTKAIPKMRVRYTDVITSPQKAVETIASYLGVEVTQEAIDAIDPSLAHWERLDSENILRGMAESGLSRRS